MNVPASPHFTAVDLSAAFNARRESLPDALRPRQSPAWTFGAQTLQGIPFLLGAAQSPNVVLLDQAPVTIEIDDAHARAAYLVFLHAVETRVSVYLPGFADHQPDGNELGDHVSDYILEYADGTTVATAIARRFAIQQSRIQWGASPFEAVPARAPAVSITPAEARAMGRLADGVTATSFERTASGRDQGGEQLWLYALPNPQPDKPIRRLTLAPRHERSVVYGLAYTALPDHPLRPGLRQKLRLELPAGASLNQLGQFEGVAVDLGSVMSAGQALDYDPALWTGRAPNVQPAASPAAVLVEYAAHPAARLFVSSGTGTPICYDLSKPNTQGIVPIAPARKPVRLRLVERGSPRPVPARLHLHGAAGEYLPPRGHHRLMSGYWFDDNYAEFRNGRNAYSYIPGECVVDLPLGEVFVEATRGYEVLPVRRSLTVTPETNEITLELERALPWRQAGWVTADTHVHFISPQTAWLEAAAEGVNVVNLLASQWGELFTNVGDFDGRTTLGAKDFGGDGEFLVRVGTENRMQVLGHISLLGYDGPMIQPLCSGGPSEAALGDPQEVAMAEWAAQCIAQNGLVVMPHAPNPQCERAADIVLGLVHAIEMMTFNPFDRQIDPYGLADWYRYLNLGYQLPVVGGSDKMSAASLLGGVRTYAHLGERDFTYENWKAAVRAGNTFATVGPLLQLQVEGQVPGGQVWLPPGGGTLNVTWKVESVSLPIEQVEIVVGGRVAEQVTPGAASQPAVGAASQPAVGAASQSEAGAYTATGSAQIRLADSTWVALRVRGSYRGQPGDVAAHTSAVQVVVGARPIFSPADATSVLEQIEGALRYVDTIAPRPEAGRYGQLRGTLLNAHRQLHQRLHQGDVEHHRGPVHTHFHE